MPPHRTPTRFAPWPLLAIPTLAFMTGSFPDSVAEAVSAPERHASREARTLHLVTSQDEQAAKRLYDRVMQEFHEKDYEAALAGFRFFLELHGTSRLAGSAQYWVGECEYRLRRYKEAIESFSLALKASHQQPKQAGATLKMALSYEHLGQTEASRILFERLLSDFSGTPEADFARKHLSPPTSSTRHPDAGLATAPTIVDRRDPADAHQ